MQDPLQPISIIIPVGPGRDAATALGSLQQAGIRGTDEVLLVGDGHLPAVDPALRDALPLRCLQLAAPAGANAARNHGAEAASHGVLAFLDDDDGYLPQALDATRSASAGQLDAAAWSLAWTIASGKRQPMLRRPARLNESDIWKRNFAGGCSSMVVRRAAFLNVGKFDPAMRSMQDWDLWLRLCRSGIVYTVREPCVFYRDHAGPRISTSLNARIAGLERLLSKHAAHWPRPVTGFHRARLGAVRFRAGIGSWWAIFQPAAPLASLYFALQALRAGRQLSHS